MPKTLIAVPPGNKRGDPNIDLFAARSKQSIIKWATEQQIREVSEQLARIQCEGKRSEANGEYFKSGNLAYEIHEIIRATEELRKRSQRAKQ